MFINGENTTDEQKIADAFNFYFSNVAKKLDDEIPNLGRSNDFEGVLDDDINPNSFFLYPVTKNECENLISHLNDTYYGLDSLSGKMFKKVKDLLSYPLSILINQSFSSGIFPDILKKGTITPIFKHGDAKNTSNFRPITILPLFSKIFEKCMSTRLTKFLTKFSILSNNQFGFIKGISCLDAVSALIEYLYRQINEKKYVISLFIDLRKAYDTVNHEILLGKLNSYGVRGIPLNWFKNYLENRFQCVRIGEHRSVFERTTIGVPQGSVLGSLLFLVYINDLPKVSNKLFSVLYADDTCMSLSNPNYETLINEFNIELNKINFWLCKNRLSLNITKTIAINFSKKYVPINSTEILKMNGNAIEFSKNVKYLGVFLDSSLSFREHINLICSKVSKTVGVLYRISSSAPKSILLKLYYSMIYPYFIYCNLIWGGATNILINPLFLLQKRVVRIITKSSYLEHSNPLFYELGILKIFDVYRYFCCLYAHKNIISYIPNVNVYRTRNVDDLQVKYQRLNITQRSIYFIVPKLFNELPYDIKNTSEFLPFKRKLKTHLISTYN